MHIISVNVGKPSTIQRGNRQVETAICKLPMTDPVLVGELGLDGDHQVAKQHHGGPDQAVYVYSQADYDWWGEQLDETPEPGTFGENLTVSDFGAETLYIGDRWQVGDVLLEITAPRFPCATLAAHMGDPEFVKRFKQSERSGAYTRVLKTGTLQAGDEVVYQRGDSDLTLLEVFRLHYEKSPSPAVIQRVLAAPIAARGRKQYEDMLAKRD